MNPEQRNPAQLARRLGWRLRNQAAPDTDGWRRETYTLPRGEAHEMARGYFAKFPKAAYMTEIEAWRELSGDRIEFTIRRLPAAD
ncbi:MAG: hypothetical protein L0Y57_07705 [Beijerinckiaceae bacterium]|nr:hypothetical protein [Beijerinckiaceae bacterium]